MAAKLALVVDDSKSARAVLARMLEQYGIQVDSCESAEDAIEYLRSNRPDVIFMDHLMPGMDGFQAVQLIKGNPLTATIPIMMYTSQEGELYVGQARALGAIGVMPKQVAPADVSKVLYQLRLLRERRDPRPSALQPVGGPSEAPVLSDVAAARRAEVAAGAGDTVAAPPSQPPLTAGEVRAIVGPALEEHSAQLREFVAASLEGVAARVVTDTRDLVQALVPPPARAPRPVGWIVAAAAGCLAAVGVGVFAWLLHDSVRSLEARLEEQSRAAAVARAELAVATARAERMAAVDPGAPVGPTVAAAEVPPPIGVFAVPYGEPPLAGARVDALRSLFAAQDSRTLTGTIRITAHTGDFCLVGNAAEGYVPAPPGLEASRCDLVGNPYDDGLRPAQRESVAFANWLAEMRALAGGRYSIVVENAARERPAVPYPEIVGSSAEAWNASARANHRVEVVFLPERSP